MPAEIRVFRCLSDNIGVLVRDAGSGACAAIDAPEEGPILRALDEAGWRLTDILVTHRHPDHVGGVAALKERFGARVTAPAKSGAAVPGADVRVAEGDLVRVGGLEAQVWETPGHCDDHVSYWFAGDGLLFSGDALFTLGCGRVLEGPPEVLHATLQRFLTLPDAAQVFCGHDYTLSNARFAEAVEPGNERLRFRAGEAETAAREGRLMVPSVLGEERATNPFLRADRPEVARSVNLEGAPPAEVFAALRAWKNRF
jgi:hydroxyacylglutathione hydrolase